jgi:hypothetical protein
VTLVIAKLALAVVAVAPHHHHEDPTELKASPPLTSHTDANAARFKYHAGVSLHRAVLVIRRLQHLHREHRRQERRDRLSVASASPVRASGSSPSAPAPTGGLVACIINSESGGNSQATNSSGHMGLGQWDQATWVADGGTRYSSTPLGATADQQRQIIQEQVAAGHTGQWTNYDPC